MFREHETVMQERLDAGSLDEFQNIFLDPQTHVCIGEAVRATAGEYRAKPCAGPAITTFVDMIESSCAVRICDTVRALS